MRLAIAIAVVAVACSVAVYIHQRTVYIGGAVSGSNFWSTGSSFWGGDTSQATGSDYVHPSWEDPAAVLIALGGLAVAVGIVKVRRRPNFAKPS